MASFIRPNPTYDALLLQFLYMLSNGSSYDPNRICHLLSCHFGIFSDKLKNFLCTFLCTFFIFLRTSRLALIIKLKQFVITTRMDRDKNKECQPVFCGLECGAGRTVMCSAMSSLSAEILLFRICLFAFFISTYLD